MGLRRRGSMVSKVYQVALMSQTDLRPSHPATRLVPLCHHRWTLPILAELHRQDGCRFAALRQGLGVSSESLRVALDAMMEAGLARRHEGDGHPLRPEYVATHQGGKLGAAAVALVDHLARIGMTEVALRKWSLPLLAVLPAGGGRFTEIREALPGATARAIAAGLRDLEAAGLVRRTLTASWPPHALYATTPAGGRIARLALALA